MVKLGPFFYIDNKLLFDAKPIEECEKRLDKYDNPCQHVDLFERTYGTDLDYIDYPRGRVVYDETNDEAIIYIDRAINNENVVNNILEAFDIDNFRIAFDDHYTTTKNNTLVIHPDDCTTDFLKAIYEGKGYDVITDTNDDDYVRQEIANHDRIIMLGHGTPYGLINSPYGISYIIDDTHADLLRDKETISIWCYSNQYFERNDIGGFHTGMIISETVEEQYALNQIPLTKHQLEENMDNFAKACRDAIELPPEEAKAYILDNYIGTDPVTEFNRNNILVTIPLTKSFNQLLNKELQDEEFATEYYKLKREIAEKGIGVVIDLD